MRNPNTLHPYKITAVLALIAIAAVLAFTAMTVSAQSDDRDWKPPVTGLTAVAGDDPGEMIISWDAHTQTTKTILNYRVAWTPEGERFKSADRTKWNAHTTNTQHTVTGLDAGATYQVKIRTRYEGRQGSRWTDVVTGQAGVTPNVPATGQPTITGTAEVGETLTAATSAISDDNGLTNAVFSHQWVRNANGSDTAITDATGSTYVITNADVGTAIKVRVNFTDDDGYTETATSNATTSVPVPAPVIVPPEEPQTAEASHEVLVSNTAQTVSSSGSSHFQAQSFTTGANAGGYTVTEIQIHLRTINTNQTTNVKVRDNNSSGQPGNLVATLSNPATLTAGALNTFTAPANTTLNASTTYWVSVSEAELSKLTYGATDGTGETGATGWSIGDTHLWRAAEGTTVWSSTTNVLVMAIHGTLNTSTASDDASLSTLTVNDGTSDLTLTPTFVSGTYAYEAEVGNAITTVTLAATVNDDDAEITAVTLDGTAITDSDFADGITVPSLVVGDNEIVVTIAAEDASTQAYTITLVRAAAVTITEATIVPASWSLIPAGLTTGDQFRLIFLSSTKRNASSTSIGDYNTFIQDLN